ncbi:MAG: AAA family ATPase [Isosphaeraceae bacterium]
MTTLKLTSVKSTEFAGSDKEWSLDELSFGDSNLIVGLNASGKTRALNTIANFANMLLPGGPRQPADVCCDFTFDAGGRLFKYSFEFRNGIVHKESLYFDPNDLLSRGSDGEGVIQAEEQGGKVRFKPPANELAAVARRDLLQHPYLELLHAWALSVRHYPFGTPLGRDVFTVSLGSEPDNFDRNANLVLGILNRGQQAYPGQFDEAVKRDMARLGYRIEQIKICPLETVKITGPLSPGPVYGIAVSEEYSPVLIEQPNLSQGMFRALSLIIQVNYSQMAKSSSCVLIDDIGEGLDFDRSTRLIDLLREKARTSSFQLIMTTNDRFVMNTVPLEEWSVLRRQGGKVTVHNYSNSREIFDEFKYTGLSNFSFLELDFLSPAGERLVDE